MGSRTMVLGVLALIAGAAAAIGVRQLARRWEPPLAEESVEVVTMVSDVPRGEMINREDLVVEHWPKSKMPNGAALNLEKTVGRVALTPFVKGQPVFENMLAPENALAGLATLVPKGMRAFTIHTPTIASGVAGFVLPGNHVDVLLTVAGSASQTDGSVTVNLLQSVEILATDHLIDASPDSRNRTTSMKSVTLLVTPEQAAKLSLAQNKGILELALRNPNDDSSAGNVPVTVADLRLRGELPDEEALQRRAEELAKEGARREAEKQELIAGMQAEMDTRLQQIQRELATTKELLEAANSSRSASPQTTPELKIRTLRGTYNGVVLIRPHQNDDEKSSARGQQL